MQKLMRKSEVSTAHGHAETNEEIRGKQHAVHMIVLKHTSKSKRMDGVYIILVQGTTLQKIILKMKHWARYRAPE